MILCCFGPYWLPLACVCISINAEASSGIVESNGRRKYGLSKERNMVGMCSQIFYLFARNTCANKKNNLTISLDNCLMGKACSGCYYILCINAFVGFFSMAVNLFSNNVNVKLNIMNMENISKYFQIALPKMMWN